MLLLLWSRGAEVISRMSMSFKVKLVGELFVFPSDHGGMNKFFFYWRGSWRQLDNAAVLVLSTCFGASCHAYIQRVMLLLL